MNKRKLAISLSLRMFLLLLFIGVLLFGSAGTLHYWQAWAYLGTFFVPATAISFYYLAHDPDFIERRMKSGEKEKLQKLVMAIISLFYFGAFVVAGFDHRYGWSNMPASLVLISDALVFISYMMVLRVFKENRYAASTIEVEEGQQVISSGPYAIIRHPMYLASMPMLAFAPLALGSYWALLCFLPIWGMLIVRILNEEAVLLRDLPGYQEYCQKVRWRLIPGIW